jgi:hypothetical protein
MGRKIDGVVAPRIDVKFVKDMAGRQDFVESRGADFEAVVVLVATIEIYF